MGRDTEPRFADIFSSEPRSFLVESYNRGVKVLGHFAGYFVGSHFILASFTSSCIFDCPSKRAFALHTPLYCFICSVLSCPWHRSILPLALRVDEVYEKFGKIG